MSKQRKNGTALSRRHYLLGAGLALSLAATMWAAQMDEADEAGADLARPVAGTRRSNSNSGSGSMPARPPAAASAAAAELAPASWAPPSRGAWAPVADAQLLAWGPPPPPPPAAAPPPPPPPPPSAPPFPYQLIGRLVDGQQATALLAGPTKALAVKAGDLVDGQWRVEQIHERGLNLIWLPAKLTQTVAFRPSPP